MQPVKNRVAVELIEAEPQKTASGIIIPDTATTQISKGTVRSVGAEVEGIVEGDVVLFEKGKGVEADGLIVLNEYDLLAIENDKKPL